VTAAVVHPRARSFSKRVPLLVLAATILGRGSGSDGMGGEMPTGGTPRSVPGKHVIFVDNYAAFVKDPNYTTTEMSNYLHPNTAGYAILGDSFYGALSAHLP
jgi:hypothetical protein